MQDSKSIDLQLQYDAGPIELAKNFLHIQGQVITTMNDISQTIVNARQCIGLQLLSDTDPTATCKELPLAMYLLSQKQQAHILEF